MHTCLSKLGHYLNASENTIFFSSSNMNVGDAGDYGVWTQKVNHVLAKHAGYYGASGCTLSMQHVHGSCWIQIDINPLAVAVGNPGKFTCTWYVNLYYVYMVRQSLLRVRGTSISITCTWYVNLYFMRFLYVRNFE